MTHNNKKLIDATLNAERMATNEKMITDAALHVRMAKTQREYFREKKKAAMETCNNRQSERVLCYVGDYAQKNYLSLPNFASEQPGDTYYYSPLRCHCFGMLVDCSTDPIRLAAMLYTKDVAKKGGNNVASLMWSNLERLGITTQQSHSRRLTL